MHTHEPHSGVYQRELLNKHLLEESGGVGMKLEEGYLSEILGDPAYDYWYVSETSVPTDKLIHQFVPTADKLMEFRVSNRVSTLKWLMPKKFKHEVAEIEYTDDERELGIFRFVKDGMLSVPDNIEGLVEVISDDGILKLKELENNVISFYPRMIPILDIRTDELYGESIVGNKFSVPTQLWDEYDKDIANIEQAELEKRVQQFERVRNCQDYLTDIVNFQKGKPFTQSEILYVGLYADGVAKATALTDFLSN